MPRKKGPRNKAKEVSYCTFKVPRDENGDFILPPVRGWAERRREIIAYLKGELKKAEHRCRYRKRPSPAVMNLRRVIKEWQDELRAGIPKGDDIYGPQELEEDEHAAA